MKINKLSQEAKALVAAFVADAAHEAVRTNGRDLITGRPHSDISYALSDAAKMNSFGSRMLSLCGNVSTNEAEDLVSLLAVAKLYSIVGSPRKRSKETNKQFEERKKLGELAVSSSFAGLYWLSTSVFSSTNIAESIVITLMRVSITKPDTSKRREWERKIRGCFKLANKVVLGDSNT